MFNIQSRKIKTGIIYALAIGIPVISIYLFKTYDLNLLLKYTPYILGVFYLVLIVYFVRCLFIKNQNH